MPSFSSKSEHKSEGGLRSKGYVKQSLIDKPLISVITVAFNAEKHLEKTLLSIINQTYGNIEYIILDGGSVDGTLDIIKKYDEKIDYWVSEKDAGIYDAMNKGIMLSNGEWLNFMNAGDMFFNNEVLHDISIHLKKAGLVYGNHAIYLKDSNKHQSIDMKRLRYRKNLPYCHQSLFIHKSWAHQFPFDLNYRIASDYDQFLKCKFAGASITHVPLTISLFLQGGLSCVSRIQLIREYYMISKQYFWYSHIVYIYRKLKLVVIGK